MVIDKKQVKYRFFLFCSLLFFSLKFVETAFVVSLTSPHVITESSIVFPNYLPFSQLNVAEFQILFFPNITNVFIPVSMLKMLRFKSSVSFKTHILLERSLGV